jgi:hypothetical protein
VTADATGLRLAIEHWSRDVHARAVEAVPDLVRPYAPVGVETETSVRPPGQLRDSIRTDGISGSGTRFMGRVVAPVIQAKTTDQGSPPHTISPRGAYPLRFFWMKKGQVVTSWGWHGEHFGRVDHPGNQASPWWAQALTDSYGRALLESAIGAPFGT